jgi:hypothetical protein
MLDVNYLVRPDKIIVAEHPIVIWGIENNRLFFKSYGPDIADHHMLADSSFGLHRLSNGY